MKKTNYLMNLAILTVLVSGFAENASASYFRFWRGQPLRQISATQFSEEINQKLLPAGGKLSKTSAKLKTYFPVLSPTRFYGNHALPIEVALLEYESQESYQQYRATDEGKAYGDLHWEMFDKDSSRSLVPIPFQGDVQFETAYRITVSTYANWSYGRAYYRFFHRTSGFSDQEFQKSILSHINHTSNFQPLDVIFLVAKDYVIEYSLWASDLDKELSDQTVEETRSETRILDELVEVTAITEMDIKLLDGKRIGYNSGVRYELD